MSAFSVVDSARDPQRLIAFLDHAARAEWGMKHYAAGVLALGEPALPILDLGCGTGHDLVLLASADLRAVGIDPSARMLERAKARVEGGPAVLVRAVGERLPFRDHCFGGCRMERVLMHVKDPAAVIREAVRCLAPGSTFTMFEPDWSSFRVRGEHCDEEVGWITSSRHPGVGGELWRLAEQAGCQVLDRVEELSVWRSLGVLDRIVGGIELAVAGAIAAGRVNKQTAEAWLHEQRGRDQRGEFLGLMPKILLVARRP